MLKQLNYKRAWEQRAREQGKCRTCGACIKRTHGSSTSANITIRCLSCKEKQKIYTAEHRKKRQAAGLCIMCGKKVEAGFKYCNRNECIPSRRLRQ